MFFSALSGLALMADIKGSTFIVLPVLILSVFGVFYGLKSRKASGIYDHPGPDSGDPVITEDSDPTKLHGKEGPGREEEKDSLLDQRGTK